MFIYSKFNLFEKKKIKETEIIICIIKSECLFQDSGSYDNTMEYFTKLCNQGGVAYYFLLLNKSCF